MQTKYYVLIAVAAIVALFIGIPWYHKPAPVRPLPDTASTTPQTQTVNIANPASTNCVQKGGTLQMQDGPNGQYGLCYFDDNRACEEWAMMRGDCPVGGVKTTGYDTIDQKYCAWLGGQTLAESNSKCTLPNGKVCSTIDLYNGRCQ